MHGLKDAAGANAAPNDEEIEALASEIAEGRRGLHQLPREGDARVAARIRRRAMELRAARAGGELSLEHTGSFSFDADRRVKGEAVAVKGFSLQLKLKVVDMCRLHVTGQHVLVSRVLISFSDIYWTGYGSEEFVVLGIVGDLFGSRIKMSSLVHGLVGLDCGSGRDKRSHFVLH